MGGKAWSDEDTELFFKLYNSGKYLSEILPQLSVKRTKGALVAKAKKLGISDKHRQFSAPSIEIVKKIKDQGHSKAFIAKKMGVSRGVINKLVEINNLDFPAKSRLWEESDEATLRNLREGGMAFEDIADQLCRSKTAIQVRCSVLKIVSKDRGWKKATRYSKEEIQQLKELRKLGFSLKEISDKMERSIRSVSRMIRIQGLQKIHPFKWTRIRLTYLEENFKNKTNMELADQFGVSETTISIKLKRLGLIRPEIEISEDKIRELYFKGIPIKQIADELNCTKNMVANRISGIGLPHEPRECLANGCNNRFLPKQSADWSRFYCSRSCREKHRRIDDPVYRIKQNTRRRVIEVLKGNTKSKRTAEIVGWPAEEAFDYFKKDHSFQLWVKFPNRYHLDHIIPLVAYGDALEDENHPYQKRVWNLRNLRFVTKKKNIQKGTKIKWALIANKNLWDLLPDEIEVPVRYKSVREKQNKSDLLYKKTSNTP